MLTQEKVKVYTVTELTREVKAAVEGTFPSLYVEGEVSNVKMPSSGHLYFTLKDATSQIQAVFFAFRSKGVSFTLQDGMKVVLFGFLTVYEKGGNYQINVKRMEPAGMGALQLAFEQLKKKLLQEGLFDAKRKRPIPWVPSKIGIITSPTGAAFRDILNVLDRRFSNVHLILAPTLVQGDGAPSQIVRALDLLNEMDEVDVIIVTRGGGSLEDLWAFNDEGVARAIFQSRIAVISAVGHEIDWTIADFVADLRVPTPTAAAELVITKKSDLLETLVQAKKKMVLLLSNRVGFLKKVVEGFTQHPVFKRPGARLEMLSQSLDLAFERCSRQLIHLLERKKAALKTLSTGLDALSPLAVLGRGYSLTRILKTQVYGAVYDIGALGIAR
ncbi:MAG: exodeoxyribonuclease VII large subunit [Chlamydiae bacterium]|nr:exodeoxyribonuclease VII large subunit [Chlamydiota bacterium]